MLAEIEQFSSLTSFIKNASNTSLTFTAKDDAIFFA
jgi:hypothetical protein